MQRITFVQVNIYKGKYLENLIRFLKDINADFVSMQEVSSGELSTTETKDADIFNVIKKALNMEGVLTKDAWLKDNKGSIGNAVLSKYRIVGSQIVELQKPREVTRKDVKDSSKFPHFPRSIIDAEISINGRSIHALCWHGAWTAPPTDTVETIKQAKLVANYLNSIGDPFIVGVDINNIIGSDTVKTVERVATNWMYKANAKQTTHQKVHKIAPKGYLVDYIFTSKHFKLQKIEVPNVLVSDHLPVVGVFEF